MNNNKYTKIYTTPFLTVLPLAGDVLTSSGANVLNDHYTDAEALSPAKRDIWN